MQAAEATYEDTTSRLRLAFRGLGQGCARRSSCPVSSSLSPNEKPVVIPPRPAASLYFHISDDPPCGNADGQSGDVPVTLGNRSGNGLSLDGLIEWLRLSGASVSVRPVIDLNSDRIAKGYRPTTTQLEQIYLSRPERASSLTAIARPDHLVHRSGVDADHITPFTESGRTSTDDLAALCRHHTTATRPTRLGAIRVLRLVSTSATSPHGLSFVRTKQGTHRITRPPG